LGGAFANISPSIVTMGLYLETPRIRPSGRRVLCFRILKSVCLSTPQTYDDFAHLQTPTTKKVRTPARL
jgi:hypothetical protein